MPLRLELSLLRALSLPTRMYRPARNTGTSSLLATRTGPHRHFHHVFLRQPSRRTIPSSSKRPFKRLPPSCPSSSNPPPPPPASPPSNASASTPRPRRRPIRPLIYATTFLLLGLLGGQFMTAVVVPPPLPVPGSDDDEYMLAKLRRDGGKLPIVQELRRGKVGGAGAAAVGAGGEGEAGAGGDGVVGGGEWVEFEAHLRPVFREADHFSLTPPARAGVSAAEGGASGSGDGDGDYGYVQQGPELTAHTLRGSRGLALHRVFWHRAERRSVAVIFFGGALSGWPGVTHGGAIATVMQESLERVIRGPEFEVPEEDRRDGGAVGIGGGVDVLDLDYKRPVQANALYVVRAEPIEGDTDEVRGDVLRARAVLENAVTGQVCVEATGGLASELTARLAGQEAHDKSVMNSVTKWFGW